MKRYEYKVEDIYYVPFFATKGEKYVADILNENAKYGWELYNSHLYDEDRRLYCIFRREVK